MRKALPALLRFITRAAAFLVFAGAVFITGFILVKGVPAMRPSLFSLAWTSDNQSMLPAFVNTVAMAALSLLLAVPLGVGAAVYLAEYSKPGSRVVGAVRLAAETLSGIPSIVYGLFGMLLFVVYLRWGYSLLAGAFTMAVMVLPVIMRTAEEALLAVPLSWREGSYGLGAGKLRTVVKIALPAAMPGIVSGVILALGRLLGETAALMFTAGTVARLPRSVFSSARTLSVHMYVLSSEGLYIDEAYAAAAVLLALTLGMNVLSEYVGKKLTANNCG
jgi:phosphate transport system permease protein